MKEKLKDAPSTVVFGQNVSAGSCLGGLSRGIKFNDKSSRVINTPNCENTAVGVGLGLMLNGVSAIFYMKQLDFLLLGIDQIVNTYNYIRTIKNPTASFSIMPAIVDSGYEGIQSSLNTVSDFSSIAMIDAYTLNNKHDSDYVINNIMLKPGFRIIGASQRLSRLELMSFETNDVAHGENGAWFKYSTGKDLTIVSFNFSYHQASDLFSHFKNKEVSASLFSVNCIPTIDWKEILNDVKRTGKVVIVDDSKSHTSFAFQLMAQVALLKEKIQVKLVKREHSPSWYQPSSDEFVLNKEEIFNWYLESKL
jgi:pyruvate dehydrogenase E1 component beta subunit